MTATNKIGIQATCGATAVEKLVRIFEFEGRVRRLLYLQTYSVSHKFLVNIHMKRFHRATTIDRCPKLNKIPPTGVALYMHCSFQSHSNWSHFRHPSVYFSFVKLRLYSKERIPDKIPFITCWNLKYFKFYGTLNFSRNGLRMLCFFFISFSFQLVARMYCRMEK